jgi:hypothetical protein
MVRGRGGRWTWAVLAAALATSLAACASDAGPRPAVAGTRSAEFPMLVDGRPVGWDVLTPLLAEAAGAEVSREVALDLILDGQLRARGIDPATIDAEGERRALLASIAAEVPDAARPATVDAIRRARGLGERRMARLAWRTAALRTLIADQVTVGPDELRLAYELRAGPRTRGRIAVVPTAEAAAALRAEVRGLPDTEARLAWLSGRAEWSVLGPISPADPTLAEPLRVALRDTAIGDASLVVPVTDGYAVVFIERRDRAADAPAFDAVRNDLQAELLRRKQRLAMDRLAEDLLARSDVRVLDAGLGYMSAGSR